MKVGVVAGGRQEEGTPRANLYREAIDATNRQLPYRNGKGSKTNVAFAEKRVGARQAFNGAQSGVRWRSGGCVIRDIQGME